MKLSTITAISDLLRDDMNEKEKIFDAAEKEYDKIRAYPVVVWSEVMLSQVEKEREEMYERICDEYKTTCREYCAAKEAWEDFEEHDWN